MIQIFARNDPLLISFRDANVDLPSNTPQDVYTLRNAFAIDAYTTLFSIVFCCNMFAQFDHMSALIDLSANNDLSLFDSESETLL